MKRLLIVVLLALAILAYSQDIIDTNSVVFAWDSVTTLIDGSDIPSGDIVEYEVYYAYPDQRDNSTLVGRTNELQYTVTFAGEGIYILGVRAVRITDMGEVYSVMAWSDEYDWMVRYLKAPSKPSGLGVR